MKLFKCMVVLALALTAQLAWAQYPNRPIRIINPFAAGGSGDIVTRIATQKITENTGKTFIIEAKTGAAGRIGYEAGVKAPPDGYTLALTDTTYTMMPALHGDIPWHTPEALQPVTVIAQSPFLAWTEPVPQPQPQLQHTCPAVHVAFARESHHLALHLPAPPLTVSGPTARRCCAAASAAAAPRDVFGF